MESRDQARIEFQRRIEHFGPLFGITRLDYERTGKGWWVRLGWRDGRPVFQETVMDSDYGGKRQASEVARRLRDEAFVDLWVEGAAPPSAPRPIRTRRNKTGIPGMSRSCTPSKTGAGYLLGWKVNWREGGKARGRSFADSSYESPFAAYRAAALFRMETEFRIYGYSIVDPGRLEEMFRQIPEGYLLGQITKGDMR